MNINAKSLFLTIIAVVTVWCASANPVDINRARRVGSTYLAAAGHRDAAALQVVKTPYTEFYVFSADGEGFVLVAADDCVQPILGYSLTGTFRTDEMPSNVRAWLEGYERDIARIKEASQADKYAMNHGSSASSPFASEWQQLTAGTALEPSLTTAVSPLLTTMWAQGSPYNSMCPYDTVYGQHVVTGCVATATAQIMKYWNHPATGYGSHGYVATNSHISYGAQWANFGATTYQWDSMPNVVTSASSQTQIDAVALLMYHVGVAIDMRYNVSSQGGSGAYNHSEYYPSAMSALVDYFKYAPDMAVVTPGGYDNAAYSAMLRAELDQQRPILYDGRDPSGGHSFVCDGYDANNLFHFNWGWGGYCDGYYALGALNPAPGGTGGNATYTFNMKNSAILHIRPNATFGNGGTVTANGTGGDSTCTVSGGGTYNFGDTVSLAAAAGVGYRFAGWTDNSQTNPRTFIMTGGNYSFTARFEPIGSDTMSYCGNLGYYTAWGEYQQGFDKYWGIKLPASSLTPGRTLKAVDFYVGEYYDGYFTLTVYTGTTAPTDTVYNNSVWVGSVDGNDWYTVYLPTPYTVEAGKNIWITLYNSDLLFPATCTYSCGNPDGFLYGPAFNPDPEWNYFSFMIRGHFVDHGMAVDGDTLSYCDRKPYYTGWTPSEWGIMIPAADLQGRNYLKSVKLFVDFSGLYTLRVYRGGADSPRTLVHTQPADLVGYGWREIMLDNTVAIGAADSLWITFSSSAGTWPAASCRYTGNPNSCWVTWGDGMWWHLNSYYSDSDYSWMIKAVTSTTAPVLPPPTVAISGDSYVGIGTAAVFTAPHTTGTTVTWNIPGGTPSSATGDTVAITWNYAAWYQITASVSNANGVGGDTMWVSVVDCDQAVTNYPYYMSFEPYENMVCFTTADIDGDGHGWELYKYGGYNGLHSYLSASTYWTGDSLQYLNMDNWLFLPKMTTRAIGGDGGEYYMQWFDRSDWAEPTHAHYGVYIDTTSGTDTANYVLLAEYNVTDSWWQQRNLDLTAFAGKTFRLAFRHYNNGGTTPLYLDDITVNEELSFFREGDTISYSGWRGQQSQLGYTSGTTRWGVMFPPTLAVNIDTVKSVLLYVIEDASYTLNIWQGGYSAPDLLLRSVDTVFSGEYGWQEFVLEPAVATDSSQPLWVTFTAGGSHPAAYARFCGDMNSDWISSNGTSWNHASDYNYPASWMIKAVLAGHNDGGHLGIEESLAADGVTVYSVLGGIVVKGAEGEDVAVYDMMGRRMASATSHHSPLTFHLPTGVYMVQVGDRPAFKVVVIR